MHGIVRTRTFEREETRYTSIERVVVRYTDGRTVTFVPEAGRRSFSEDDMLELVEVLRRASATAEWVEIGGG